MAQSALEGPEGRALRVGGKVWQHAAAKVSGAGAAGRFSRAEQAAKAAKAASTANALRHWRECLEVLRVVRLGQTQTYASFASPFVDPFVISSGVAISGCASSQHWRISLCLAKDLQRTGLQTNTVIYNACISAGEKGREWQKSVLLLEEIKRATLLVDVISCSAVISACEKSGLWHDALRLLGTVRWGALQPNVVTFSAALSACAKAGHWQQALVSEMRRHQLQPNTITYNSQITSCEWQQSLLIWAELRQRQLHQTAITCGAMGTAMASSLQWCLSLSLVYGDFTADGLVLNNRVLHTSAISACSSRSQWTRAFNMLSTLQESCVQIGMETFIAHTAACGRLSLWQRASLVLSRPQWGVLSRDLVCCNVVLDNFAKIGEWRRALCTFGDLVLSGLLPDVITCTSGISACGKAKSWFQSLLLLERAQLNGLRGNMILYNALMAAWERGRQWELAVGTLDFMLYRRLGPSLNAFDSAMLVCLDNGRADHAWQLLRDSSTMRSPVSFLWSMATLAASDPAAIYAACKEASAFQQEDLPYLVWSCAMLGVELSPRLRLRAERSLAPQFLASLDLQALSMAVYGAASCVDSEVLCALQEMLGARLRSGKGRLSSLSSFAFHESEGQELLGILFSCKLAGALQAGFREAVACKLQDVGVAFDRMYSTRKKQVPLRFSPSHYKNPEVMADMSDRSVLNKPAGWEVYGQHVKLQLSAFVVGVFGHRPILEDPDHNYGFLHRLDVPSSGLILIAKTYEAFYDLQVQLHAGEVGRDYAVLCHGWLPRSVTRISASTVCLTDAPTVAGGRGRWSVTKLLFSQHRSMNQSALTHALLSIVTGRKHQIRCHMAHVGHPIVRDKMYASLYTFREDAALCMRNWLHRFRLSFVDARGMACEVKVELPQDLRRSLMTVMSLNKLRAIAGGQE